MPNPATHVPMGLAQLPRVISHQVDPPLVMHARVPAPLTRFASTCPQVSIVVRRAQDDVEGSSFIYECKDLRRWGGLVAALLWTCIVRDAVMALGKRERQRGEPSARRAGDEGRYERSRLRRSVCARGKRPVSAHVRSKIPRTDRNGLCACVCLCFCWSDA